MKFLVTMKDPDHTTQNEAGDTLPYSDKSADKIKSKFMEYDEYLTVEFDTETGTARVLTAKETRGAS